MWSSTGRGVAIAPDGRGGGHAVDQQSKSERGLHTAQDHHQHAKALHRLRYRRSGGDRPPDESLCPTRPPGPAATGLPLARDRCPPGSSPSFKPTLDSPSPERLRACAPCSGGLQRGSSQNPARAAGSCSLTSFSPPRVRASAPSPRRRFSPRGGASPGPMRPTARLRDRPCLRAASAGGLSRRAGRVAQRGMDVLVRGGGAGGVVSTTGRGRARSTPGGTGGGSALPASSACA